MCVHLVSETAARAHVHGNSSIPNPGMQSPEGAESLSGRKRIAAQNLPGESSKRECSETTRYSTHEMVTTPGHLLGQPSSSMLDTWLQEDFRPGGVGPIVLKRIPEGLRVLVPMMLDGSGVLSLCQRVRDIKGAAVVALVADEGAVRSFFKDNCLEFTVETLRWMPPWYMDASKLEHLTRPLQIYTATQRPLTVYACDVMDPSFGQHSGSLKGSFHRVWDQGKVAHTPPALRAELVEKIRSYTSVPAQLLVCGSVHEPGEIASSLPGTAYSLRLAEMQALCGNNSAVHRAKQVNRSGAQLSSLGLSSQQGCIYWIWFLKNSEVDVGLDNLRPPSCPCCK